ncbi:ATP-binding protein [Tannockella kyphosi]|uniref:ATP-binding protein n=1 Tax=Tannockella kyphosi TaxID=2899121 RepID=UPI0020134563|nr:ATP-binding protein [Tannockella kyphosi]
MELYIYQLDNNHLDIKECYQSYLDGDFSKVAMSLIEMADKYDFSQNLWHSYLTYLLVHNENCFTLALERKEDISLSLELVVKNDLAYFYQLFQSNIEIENKEMNTLLKDFKNTKHIVNKEIFSILLDLQNDLSQANNIHDFYNILKNHYIHYGVGKYGLNKAFRYYENSIRPIIHIGNESLDDLIGCVRQKQALCKNTEAFLLGKEANNVLLYGDNGTGKSSSIKALLNRYYKDGLRMVEVYKHQFIQLPSIIQELQSRDYKFIIFMDDLSFEEFEVEYKYLKAVIEGGLEKKPENILIYATSNRRHLIKQTWGERSDDEINVNDAKQEKLSLSARFGESILFAHPDRKEYLEIIDALAVRYKRMEDKEKLHASALTWAIRHGGYSGRIAKQFILSLD